MKFVFTTLIVLLSLNAAQAAEPIFPPGSAVGLVPPPGMSPATSFAGFQDEMGGAAIIVSMLPPAGFPGIAAAFSDDGKLASQGITASSRENLTIDGNPALLVVGHQQTALGLLNKWILLVGSPTGTAIITMQYGDAAIATYPEAVIKASLLTTVFRGATNRAEQVAALPFTVPPLGNFRVVDILAGFSLMLTNGPKDFDQNFEQSSVMIASVKQTVPPVDRESFSRAQLLVVQQLKVEKTESVRTLSIGRFPTVEVIGTGQSPSGAPLKVVQWTIFGPQQTILMMGLVRPEAFDEVLPQLDAIRDGVAPK